MPQSFKNDLLLRAARGERTPRPPVWLMRQAGRTDPQYNAYKARLGKPLEELFRDPEAAAHISLLPKRLGVDGIIFFQDILTPLAPMGCEFVFRPGPVTETPVRSGAAAAKLDTYDVAAKLPFVGETFERVYDSLDGELPVLGFAGAPLTLLVFMAEGRSFGAEAPHAMAFLDNDPEGAHALLDALTEMTIDYLGYQIDCGAAAVQLFESAANLLTPEIYRDFALPYQQRIFEALKGRAPAIMFAREWDDVASLDASGADILSLPATVTLRDARAIAGADRVLQGNLDNRLLAAGTLEEIEAAAKRCVDDGERRGHIFNLSHGLLRETPFENIQHLMKVLHEY